MGNTRSIPLDVMERIERLERSQWRSDVSTAAVGGAEVQNFFIPEGSPDILDRLKAIEDRLSEIERKVQNG